MAAIQSSARSRPLGIADRSDGRLTPVCRALEARPPEPWHSFLADLDALLTSPVDLHCHGGFVVEMVYNPDRSTSDIDCLAIRSTRPIDKILDLAGIGSRLYEQYGVYIQYVGIVKLSGKLRHPPSRNCSLALTRILGSSLSRHTTLHFPSWSATPARTEKMFGFWPKPPRSTPPPWNADTGRRCALIWRMRSATI